MGMLATIAVYATLSIKSYLYILGKVILETFSFTVSLWLTWRVQTVCEISITSSQHRSINVQKITIEANQ